MEFKQISLKMLDHQLTIQELIDLLMEIPDKSVLVTTEGCDCTGYAFGVEYYTNNGVKAVEIRRK